MEFSLARDIKDNEKDIYKFIISNKKNKGDVWLLLDHMGVLVLEDTEKAELLNAFFASVFTAENSLQESQTSEVRRKGWRMEDLLVEGWVRDQLRRLNTHKAIDLMGCTHVCSGS